MALCPEGLARGTEADLGSLLALGFQLRSFESYTENRLGHKYQIYPVGKRFGLDNNLADHFGNNSVLLLSPEFGIGLKIVSGLQHHLGNLLHMRLADFDNLMMPVRDTSAEMTLQRGVQWVGK